MALSCFRLANFLTGKWFSDYYVAPWCRYQSYGVGILYGYAIWKTKGRWNVHWVSIVYPWYGATLCFRGEATPNYYPLMSI